MARRHVEGLLGPIGNQTFVLPVAVGRIRAATGRTQHQLAFGQGYTRSWLP